MQPPSPGKNAPVVGNAGFTLLEIIAVIVIMSILAVVAVPRYFDLQGEARKKAMETAMAEAIGRVNGYFAQQVLRGSLPSEINYQDGEPLGTDLGDFELSVFDGGHSEDEDFDPSACFSDKADNDDALDGCIKLVVSPKDGTAIAGADDEIKSIPRPGI
ncbi:type II secretion system protein [Desulfatitalea alkaliphila]|uniref:Type II secretion system GspH family protein n=1 Tax=Desulfatitalea alkaliphila TaxID=2929485 RepID=A0AA41ULW3_9BACT|nr:type II secretion system protein [Desulfatitalea alkaliphila]MCJ8501976.1 type II secretion system GspH family protein [Desulfatitalea alkaliphila]